ncbi:MULTISPECIES: ferritin-like domain-containing protein [Asticcacaulis]|uniref:ferritin-like domain-containing protein n=1 Tax=Asticcacaulis TaxID=76890 RepID=UPI001AE9DAAB|nr:MULTISPECIES: ferritin-like domain-containing protein [Asticcacaulis]MBP2161520.1 hypothetical protein [Asticcacaulis solisilvae]MDR6802629.1 hypothetical protein [Asticcacaulis sp. BE141]
MQTSEWLAYFEHNAGRASPQTPARLAPLPAKLQEPLVHALQCFQLGEAGEGRIAQQARQSTDPALDDNLKESIAFYVREEGRHATELARLIRAMGEATITKHMSEQLFERSRRLMGLRAKMAVMAVAEVVGAAFYMTLAERVPCPHIADVMRVISADEDRHLEFQRGFFKRVLATTPVLLRPIVALGLWFWFLNVLAAGIAAVAFGHSRLFKALGIGPWRFSWYCARRFYRLAHVPTEVEVSEQVDLPSDLVGGTY